MCLDCNLIFSSPLIVDHSVWNIGEGLISAPQHQAKHRHDRSPSQRTISMHNTIHAKYAYKLVSEAAIPVKIYLYSMGYRVHKKILGEAEDHHTRSAQMQVSFSM